jgi:hypothetical protein
MLVLQIVPSGDQDAYKLLRAKILHEASTWSFANKAKSRLKHVQRPKGGYVEVGGADGVLVARIHAKTPSDQFYLAEKFIGRMVAWFESELLAVNIQFRGTNGKARRR